MRKSIIKKLFVGLGALTTLAVTVKLVQKKQEKDLLKELEEEYIEEEPCERKYIKIMSTDVNHH